MPLGLFPIFTMHKQNWHATLFCSMFWTLTKSICIYNIEKINVSMGNWSIFHVFFNILGQKYISFQWKYLHDLDACIIGIDPILLLKIMNMNILGSCLRLFSCGWLFLLIDNVVTCVKIMQNCHSQKRYRQFRGEGTIIHLPRKTDKNTCMPWHTFSL